MKVGVIGAGKMGENHIRTYLSLTSDCQFVGLYDVDPNRRESVAAMYNVKPFSSLDALLQEVDAVSITVPTVYHYEIALACIDQHVHMLIEKPITSSVKEAKELAKRAKQAGVFVQVGHIELFNPLIKAVQYAVMNETIIAIETHRMSAFSSRLEGVDVVQDLMLHDLYILASILGPDCLNTIYTIGHLSKGLPIHAVAIAKTSTGAAIQLTASYQSNKNIRSIHLLTENAYMVANLLTNELAITRRSDSTGPYARSITETIHAPTIQQPLTLELQSFLSCLKEKKTPAVTADDGIKALIVANQISQSIEKHTK
ncbi:Gfo/Idh/MocA family oxidoreductase [Alkalihalobacillus sp. LMS6]|uniref:Gfo/Idh/MocA family protein n=1 Tax=Alkalihalobacillus sp. LMS6 TaxID=2924034 RepID=UPI0020D13F08|nr:Gfo/Idh/MocA family oxidoreductase [Alkalihalobacillus sp. LMS6]UTR08175.1 Gfo/Idh/MocA family oxidoreductase [Alkalihalobacillus sp. LMS6]